MHKQKMRVALGSSRRLRTRRPAHRPARRVPHRGETVIGLTRFLSEQGVGEVIQPQLTKTGRTHARMEGIDVIVYPFIDGKNGYEVELTARQWADFGAALKKIHSMQLPSELAHRL